VDWIGLILSKEVKNLGIAVNFQLPMTLKMLPNLPKVEIGEALQKLQISAERSADGFVKR
jgi:hypothetical protein